MPPPKREMMILWECNEMNWFDGDVRLTKYGSCDCTIYGGWKVVQHK